MVEYLYYDLEMENKRLRKHGKKQSDRIINLMDRVSELYVRFFESMLDPCMHCKDMCMYFEEVEDWNGKGKVVRISSGCDESDGYDPDSGGHDKDFVRTEFDLEHDAVNQWNEMNREKT